MNPIIVIDLIIVAPLFVANLICLIIIRGHVNRKPKKILKPVYMVVIFTIVANILLLNISYDYVLLNTLISSTYLILLMFYVADFIDMFDYYR